MESENGKPLFTKRLLLIVVAVILLVLIVFLLLKRCGNGGNSKVEQITLTPTRVNLKVGEQQQVYSNVYPEDAKDSSVYWESEDPTIASVDQNGVVTGIKNGVTTITAKANDDGGAVGSTTVTVGDDLPELEQIQLNKSIYTVYVGSTVLIEATPVPSTAQLLDIKYSTRDTNIATVDDSGRIKGVKVGSTIITITANEGKVQTTATVKVVANSGGGSTKPDTPSDAKIPVSAINLTATETCYKLKVGNSYTIETNILPNDATDKTLTWEVVSAEDANDAAKNKIAKTYASVSDTGVVKGLKEGNARIKITAKSGVYSYFDIKVISSGNEGYCTTNNNGGSSGDNTGNNTGGNGSNPSGGGTTVTKPSSVKFGCSTAEYSNSCQYNVRVLLPGAYDLVSNGTIDTFYTCLSNTASGCTDKSTYKKSTWDSISETGSYKYCAYYAKGGSTSNIVCSEYKLITIKKGQTEESVTITGDDTVGSGSLIKLTAEASNFTPVKYKWESSNTSCANVGSSGKTVNLVSISSITSDCTVTITVTAIDKNDKSLEATKTIKVKKHQTSATINAPTITAISNSKTYSSGSWTKSNVDIVLGGAKEDEEYYHNGSKLAGYQETITTEGSKTITYKICKKSNPSTCGNSKTITIKIDKTAPSCGTVTGAGSSSSWAKSRTVNVTCTDKNGSGCSESSYSKTWSSTLKVGYITINDKAGNTNSCPVNVYVDTTAPSISCKINSDGTNGVNITVTASDADSGLTINISGTKTITSEKKYAAIDKAGNSSTCAVTVTKSIYDYKKEFYSCAKPTWNSPNKTYGTVCNVENGPTVSYAESYTTCKVQLNKALCNLPSDSTSTCYLKSVYTRKGCDSYKKEYEEIQTNKCPEFENAYGKYVCTVNSYIYSGKIS